MPQKNLSTPSRFAHSRSLSSCPATQIFERCQELWIEGDQAALSVPFCIHLCTLRQLGQAGVGRADEGWIEVKRFGLYEAVGHELTGERVLPPCVLSD